MSRDIWNRSLSPGQAEFAEASQRFALRQLDVRGRRRFIAIIATESNQPSYPLRCYATTYKADEERGPSF